MMELMSGAPPAWGIGAANAREIDERTVTKKASLKDIANGVTEYGRNLTINIGREDKGLFQMHIISMRSTSC